MNIVATPLGAPWVFGERPMVVPPPECEDCTLVIQKDIASLWWNCEHFPIQRGPLIITDQLARNEPELAGLILTKFCAWHHDGNGSNLTAEGVAAQFERFDDGTYDLKFWYYEKSPFLEPSPTLAPSDRVEFITEVLP